MASRRWTTPTVISSPGWVDAASHRGRRAMAVFNICKSLGSTGNGADAAFRLPWKATLWAPKVARRPASGALCAMQN